MRERDYAELVKDLRCHAGTCEYKETECSRYNKRFDDTDYTTCSEELCDDAADAIEELIAERDKALNRLCEFCGICSEKSRSPLECEIAGFVEPPKGVE